MTPISGLSMSRMKPSSSQKSLICGHSSSGVPPTTSQRCVPARSMRMDSDGVSTALLAVAVAGWPARSAL